MTSPFPISCPTDAAPAMRAYLGRSRHPGTGWRRRDGEVWLALHRDAAPWTAVWRLDGRDGRTLHLERVWDGDRRAEAADWARAAFALEDEAPLALVA